MIVGTSGHVDHGKTALVRALTGVDTDRLKEEKARGISIDLGFAYMPAADGQILGFVDVPGHERFVHNMLAGVAGIDFVLLVVAADDGVMPQTREHLAILDLLGVSRGLCVLTKTDLVPPSRREEVKGDLRALLAGTGLEDAEIVEASSATGAGIDDLRARLIAEAASAPRRPEAGRFRLAVDRSFTLAGAGTVVTGTVLSGAVATGDQLRLSPSGLGARVRSIHAQNRPAERGRAGERVALNLAGDGVGKDAIARGDVALDPSLHAPTSRIDVELRVLASEPKPLGAWLPVRLHHAAVELGARLVPLSADDLPPGARGWVQLVLERPIAAASGDRFILRDTSSSRTIAGGVFVDLRAPSRKRRTPERLKQLAALALPDPAASVAALLDLPPHYLDLSAFARDRALGAGEVAALADRLGLVRLAAGEAVYALAAKGWTGLRQGLAQALAAFHKENPDLQGVPREKLRMKLSPRLPPPAFAAALQALMKLGEVAADGAWLRLPSHQARLTPDQENLWARIRPLLGGAERFRPPRVRDLAGALNVPENAVRALLKLAARMGRVDEVAHDHFFLRPALAETVAICSDLAAQAEGNWIAAADLRDRLDNGRKVAIQILEFFDRHDVTFRRGDLRRLNPHRLDLFGAADKTPAGRESPPVGRPDFKSGKGRETVLGGFDPHSLPPVRRGAR